MFRQIPERFKEPRDKGTMFCYRRIDVMRVSAIAYALSREPRIIDVGCSNGDWTYKLRHYVRNIVGIDKDPKYQSEDKPWLLNVDVNDVSHTILGQQKFDLAFLGWMEIREDYREATSKLAPVIVTTWERGGACGVNGTVDFTEFGFRNICAWRTPAWFDIELHVALLLPIPRDRLYWMDAGNFFEVWAKPNIADKVTMGLKEWLAREPKDYEPYDFEHYLDEAGYKIDDVCWKVHFNE